MWEKCDQSLSIAISGSVPAFTDCNTTRDYRHWSFRSHKPVQIDSPSGLNEARHSMGSS